MRTLYWHDYETFGSNPRVDRACQFAGIRTDEELNIVGDPLVIYCKPADDFLPDPGACVVTGITPQKALAEGLSEAGFCRRIHQEFTQPNTCVVGYNNIRFDDEVTRHLFYRCFHDPYEREWKNGNSRWDIIDMLRLTHAIRPDGIHWPKREDGSTSFRLEDLTRANSIEHAGAHDALVDVLATIEVAKLVRRAQPKLYDYYYQHRFKNAVIPLLNPEKREPVLHVSGMFGAQKGNMAVVIPLLHDLHNKNAFHVYDLSVDPASWIDLPAGEIRERLYTPSDELPEGVERVALKTIHANKCPVVAPLSVLDETSMQRWGLDMTQCRAHLEQLESVPGLDEKLQEVFAKTALPALPPALENDPDLMLYSGSFFSTADRTRMQQVHQCLPEELAGASFDFQDPRLPEMLFRFRARNFPDTLDAEEKARWQSFREQRLDMDDAPWLSRSRFWNSLAETREQHPDKSALLDEVEAYARAL